MKTVFVFIGATLAGYIGWYAFIWAGVIPAFFMSTVASGFGMYYGNVLSKRLLD